MINMDNLYAKTEKISLKLSFILNLINQKMENFVRKMKKSRLPMATISYKNEIMADL